MVGGWGWRGGGTRFHKKAFNGFTVCCGETGNCIITCLLVHRLASSVSQLKAASVCGSSRKRRRTIRQHYSRSLSPIKPNNCFILATSGCLCSREHAPAIREQMLSFLPVEVLLERWYINSLHASVRVCITLKMFRELLSV